MSLSLGTLALSLYLILIGLVQVFGLDVSSVLLGVLALIAGLAMLVDGVHPIRIGNRT